MLTFDPTSTNALRHRLYLQWILGFIVGAIGLWMTRLTLGYIVWELTNSVFLTGLTALLLLAVPGVLGPFVGVWVENQNPKLVIIGAQVCNLATYLGLAVIAFVGAESALPYLLASGVAGLILAVWQPARLVIPTFLVPEQALPSAVAINSTLFNLARITGPAIASFVIAQGGISLSFFLGFLLYGVFFLSVLFLPLKVEKKTRPITSFWAQFAEGFSAILASPMLLIGLIAATLSGFFGRSIVELMPAINGQFIAAGDVQSLGILTSLVGLGAIATGTSLALLRGSNEKMILVLLAGNVLSGLTMIGMSFSSGSLLLYAMAFFAGAAASMTMIGSQSIMLRSAPKGFRARIMALWGAFSFGGVGLGGTVAGGLAGFIGLSLTLIIFGILGALASSLLFLAPRDSSAN